MTSIFCFILWHPTQLNQFFLLLGPLLAFFFMPVNAVFLLGIYEKPLGHLSVSSLGKGRSLTPDMGKPCLAGGRQSSSWSFPDEENQPASGNLSQIHSMWPMISYSTPPGNKELPSSTCRMHSFRQAFCCVRVQILKQMKMSNQFPTAEKKSQLIDTDAVWRNAVWAGQKRPWQVEAQEAAEEYRHGPGGMGHIPGAGDPTATTESPSVKDLQTSCWTKRVFMGNKEN